ncbi:hypothetical protein [Sphingobacterium siyangense]|uniref:tetratricopeptide repeat protein n=1 Tax=Sphingobacterium siyangense TaxID=459529 RepID=UPI002FDA6C93
MKKDKNLKIAVEIYLKIQAYPSTLNSEEKRKLYWIAFGYIRKSAYSGNAEGQYEYAQQFDSVSFLGINNPLYDPKRCIYWYTKSANGGFAEAYNNLADFYERGEGVKKDLLKSYELYKKGAELGSATAKSNLKIFEKDIKKGKYKLALL